MPRRVMDLTSAEKAEHRVAQAQAGGPTMTPGKGLDIITEPDPSVPITYDAIIKAGIAQSQYGRRVRGRLIFDLLSRDIVRLSVPLGEPAAELSGGITYSLNPGGRIYVQPRVPLPQEVFISVNGRKTDTIVVNTKQDGWESETSLMSRESTLLRWRRSLKSYPCS